MWANLALIFSVIALERFPGERWWPTMLLTYAPQEIWAVPSVLLTGYLLFKKRWVPAAVTTALIGVVATVLIGVPIPHKASKDSSDLRVLTWNLRYGQGGPFMPDLALSTSPDIICLQEANPWADLDLAGTMDLPQFKDWHMKQCGELVILSRFPMKRLKTSNSALWVTVNVNGQEVWIVDIHLALPLKRSLMPITLYANKAIRDLQVRELMENIPLEHPVIVCGDFNTAPNMEAYRRINSILTNSFEETGQGLGLSFRRNFPVVRIDHIFTKQAKPIRCWLPDANASDHSPLCADIKLPQDY